MTPFLHKVAMELMAARAKHPGKQNSLHEGYAVLLEEVEEFWAMVKMQTKDRDPSEPPSSTPTSDAPRRSSPRCLVTPQTLPATMRRLTPTRCALGLSACMRASHAKPQSSLSKHLDGYAILYTSGYDGRCTMTEEQVYQRLLAAIEQAGGQRPFAGQIGVTPSYINDIVNKRRLLSDRILAVIGVERVVTTDYRERSV